MNLICGACGKSYPFERTRPRCDVCNEPLEVQGNPSGPIIQGLPLTQTLFERYANFSPFKEVHASVSLGEGFTTLLKAPRIAAELGIREFYIKNETENPTWSFKDRGTVSGVQHALEMGIRRIGTVSTGNMAVSVAAYGARIGLETIVLVSEGIADEKLGPIAIHGPRLIRVNGDYGELYFKSLLIGEEKGIYFINSDVPLRVEGSKTIAFEICEQLGFQAPDYVVVPTSAGGNFRGILKGFEEFHAAGLIDRIPRMVCAQASGCSPIYNAWVSKQPSISRVDDPHTIAHAIENPYPPSGNQVLRRLEANGGTCVAVPDEEILAAQREMASEGIFGQPAAAVPLACVKKMRREDLACALKPEAVVVCIASGSGLKYTAALQQQRLNIERADIKDLGRLL